MVKTKKVPVGWELTPLSKVLVERTERKGKTDVEIYSVAVNKGIVNQVEHLGRSYAAEDTSNYNLVSFGDIVYTKSPTGDFPYGIVKQSHVKQDVAVSPLYGVYKPGYFYLGLFLDYYFQSHFNANNYLKKIVNKGAKNTILVSNQGFLHNCILLPNDPLEQQEIIEILMTQDKIIALKEKLLEAKKKQKKWLMQNLLTGKIRLMGFNGHWRQDRLGSYFTERIETNCQELNLLSVTGEKGIIPRTEIKHKDNSSEDKSKYLKVHIGDIAYNTMRMWQGVSAISAFEGIVSPAYTVLAPVEGANSLFFSYLFKLKHMINIFYRNSQGLVDDQRSLKFHNFARIKVSVPTFLEQTAIAKHLATVDNEIELLTKDLESQKNLKKYLMQQLLTGKIRL